jgi:flagellar M-ring protein FliF
MSKFWQQLVNIWSRLEIAQKATIVLSAIGAIALAAFLAVGATQPSYQLLARDLDRAKSAEIAAFLEQKNIPYKVVDRDTAVLVPSQHIYRLRNELAQQDMLGEAGKGFELLDKGGFLESTFREHRNYDRAVAGELERSFREIPGVRGARVIIDRPEPSPFVGQDEARPRASIKLDLASGTRLNDRQIQGVIALTAGAVSGLDHDHVEIMDGSGILTPKQADSGAAMAQTTLEAESAREAYLTRKAQELLDATLGPGRSSVKVSVKMDFTKRSTATSDPTKSVMLRENTRTSDEKTPVMPAGGVTGTAPNVEGEGQTTAAKPAMGSKTQEEVKNEYVVGKSTVTQEDEVGRISGMTVSILLDYKTVREPKKDDKGNPTKEMEEKRVEYTETERKRFQDLVLNAIGFNSARGLAAQGGVVQNVDNRFSVTVQSLEMWREPTEPVKAGLPLNLPMNLSDMAGYIIAGVVALALIIIARSQLSRSHRAWAEAESRARAKAEEEERRKKVEVRNEEEEEEDSNEAQAMRQRRQELRDKIRKQVSEDPASAAQIVRKWLYEGA